MHQEEARRLAILCLPPVASGEATLQHLEIITHCRLWSGKGYIYELVIRLNPPGDRECSIIVKHVTPSALHSLSDRRKAASYQVEANFYEKLAPQLIDEHQLRIATPYVVEHGKRGELIVCMSKLSGSSNLSPHYRTAGLQAAMQWLATFHAAYWGNALVDDVVNRVGLQPIGSYWYLDTRMDEHRAMPDRGWEGRLKRAARAIDLRLQRDPLQCLIHGDAKDENIMWELVCSSNNNPNKKKFSKRADGADAVQVSMYDFQYCGKGPPSRDLAYFFCCCDVVDTDLEEMLVNHYYSELMDRLTANSIIDKSQWPQKKQLIDSLELAYCDFCRFMSGWGYFGADLSKRVQAVLHRLDGGKLLGSEKDYEESIRREYG